MLKNKNKIREFLSRALRGRELGDDEDMFNLGIVHSLFVMQIILFIEKEFSIELEPEELDISQLSTVNNICGLLKQTQSESA